jgi:hypothetical protein
MEASPRARLGFMRPSLPSDEAGLLNVFPLALSTRGALQRFHRFILAGFQYRDVRLPAGQIRS